MKGENRAGGVSMGRRRGMGVRADMRSVTICVSNRNNSMRMRRYDDRYEE